MLVGVGLGLVLLAKGLALFPVGFSIDSYPKLVAMSGFGDLTTLRIELVSQGRLGQLALNEALSALGLANPGANFVCVLLAMVLFVLAGVMLTRLWKLDGDLPACAVVVGLFAVHPYNAEIFTFREAVLVVGASVYLGILGLRLTERFGRSWAAGVLAITAALAFYQVSVNFVAAALAVTWLVELSASRAAGEDLRRMLARALPRAAALASGVLLYAVVYVICQKLAGWTVEQERGALLSASQLGLRVDNVIVTTWKMFIAAEPVMPPLVKALVAVLAVLAVGGVAARAAASRNAAGLAALVLALGLFGAGGLATMGIMLALESWWPVDRMLAAVSVLVAGFAAIAVAAGPWTRRWTLAVSAVLLFAFVGANNVVLSEQLRLNYRDRATATRIVDRLEQQEGFSPSIAVAIVGFRPAYPLGYLTAETGSDLNASAFGKPWSNLNLLREVSGYPFRDPDTSASVLAEAACAGAPPWPRPESVRIIEDVAVVCFDGSE